MIAPNIPEQENLRLEALQSLHILDSHPEKEFDAITALAAQLCNTEMSLISLIDEDRQWFKSTYGTPIKTTPRAYSFCAHAITSPDEILVVPDAQKDIRFQDNPLTLTEQPVIFYTGVPLLDKNNFALGTLCVIDSTPRDPLAPYQLEALQTLANQVVTLFELKNVHRAYEHLQKKLKNRNESLRKIGRIVSHDVKGPIANIITTTDLLQLKLEDALDKEDYEYFGYIKQSSFEMSTYINNILSHYESDHFIYKAPEDFFLNEMLERIEKSLLIKISYQFTFPKTNVLIHTNKSELTIIFTNLLENSIRYNDKKTTHVTIEFSEDEVYYYFKVIDNGMGIPEDKIDTILDLFSTANVKDRNGIQGNGIGLSTVKKTVHNMGGLVSISSTLSVGTTVQFSIKKHY